MFSVNLLDFTLSMWKVQFDVPKQLPKEDNNYNKKEEEDEDAKDKYVVWCIGAWVTWPERPKGAKDKVKMPEGQKAGPKGRQLEVGAQRAPRLLVVI